MASAERLTESGAQWLPSCEVHEAVVRCALYDGRWDWARAALDSWQRDVPQDAAVPYLRGRIHELQDEVPEALEEYDEALRLQPSLSKADFRKGAILRGLRQFDEAVAAFLHCRHSALTPIAMIEVADCRWQQGDNDAAWKVLEPYVEQPVRETTELYLQVEEFVEEDRGALVAARIRDGQNDPEAAVPLLQRVLDFNPRNVEARNLLIANFRRLGRGAEADAQTTVVNELLEKRRRTTDLRRLLDEHPDDLEMRCELAELYLEAESLMHAQLELTTVLNRSSDHARAHRLMAMVFREKARHASEFSFLADYHDLLAK